MTSLITIGARNNAPTASHPTHHYYCVHLDSSNPDAPFCFEEDIAGGHAAQGGAVWLSRDELDGWVGNWREHAVHAGCAWIVALIDSLPEADTPTILAAISEAREGYGFA